MSYVAQQPDVPDPPGGTKLITRQRTLNVLTLNCETDSHTALTRGLKEYLGALEMDWRDGQRLRFRSAFDTWAVPEDALEVPALAVYATDQLSYGGAVASPLTPKILEIPGTGSPGITVRNPTYGVLRMVVEVWAKDPEMRLALASMIESALNPMDDVYGFWLDLPHYHNVRAKFHAVGYGYTDDEGKAHQNYRQAAFVVEGELPIVVPRGRGVHMRPRVAVTLNSETLPTRKITEIGGTD